MVCRQASYDRYEMKGTRTFQKKSINFDIINDDDDDYDDYYFDRY